VRDHTKIGPVRTIPEIRLHLAHAASGLWRLGAAGSAPPYWAYAWAGGAALARHLLDHPMTVADRRVLDLGAGSGLVAIAAARAGAAAVTAAEIDPYALAALRLNAELNGVAIAILGEDVTGGPPPAADIVLVGDLFYDPEIAARVTAFLARCRAAGGEVLVGDPGRTHLPLARLTPLATYPVSDFGEPRLGTVFAFDAKA
jgi:predicted nicotinamide N-methyase